MNKNIGWKLLVPILLLLAVCWYQFVFVATRDQIAAANAQREEVETNLTIEQARSEKRASMLSELETLKSQQAVTEIPDYDNIQNVMNTLNTVLAQASSYQLTFADPVKAEDSNLVRRNVTLTFRCPSLAAADTIIRDLYASPYRCVIDSMALAADDAAGTNNGTASLSDDAVSVTMAITYYELAEN
jgi:hypothetical protein